MKRLFTRKRLAMFFAVLGIGLMGVDLMITRNFFTHVGELMVASIVCFVIGIVLDRDSGGKPEREKKGTPRKNGKGFKAT
jgi:ABC-type microcin C transport system permease subunit YejB